MANLSSLILIFIIIHYYYYLVVILIIIRKSNNNHKLIMNERFSEKFRSPFLYSSFVYTHIKLKYQFTYKLHDLSSD
jgi:hypothetical protein